MNYSITSIQTHIHSSFKIHFLFFIAHQYEKLFDGFECDEVATPPPPPLEEIPIDKMSIGGKTSS